MNDESSVFVEPDFIDLHLKIKTEQKQVLDSVNPDNVSLAIRKVIDEYSKHKKILNRDKFILNICIGLLLVGMGLITSIWYASLIFYCAGIGCIIYGVCYYLKYQRDKL